MSKQTSAESERLRIQALGAALSRRDWHATERAYEAIRDEFDRRPAKLAQSPNRLEIAKIIAGNIYNDIPDVIPGAATRYAREEGLKKADKILAALGTPAASDDVKDLAIATARERIAELEEQVESLRGHLDQALRQWKMYAEMTEDRSLPDEKSLEGAIYRDASAAISSTVLPEDK